MPGTIDERKLAELIEPDKFQVFLLSSPIPFPASFAIHAWFVTSRQGEVHRYEFGKFKNSPNPNGIGLLKDFLKPTAGMNILPWNGRWRYSSNLIDMISGDSGSVAAGLISFLENYSEDYPHKSRYWYLGPNSNTYVEWVLQHFKNCGLALPYNAIGKSTYAQPVTFTSKKHRRLVNLRDQ